MTPDKRSEVGIDLTLGYEGAPRERPNAPFCLLVLGDFAGEAARSGLADRRALAFDRDDLDDVLARVHPVIRPAAAGGPVRFRSLEDFHPDHLFAALPLFETLRELRSRLLDNRTFAETARALTGEAAPAAQPAAGVPGGSLLEQLVAETAPSGTTSYPDATSGPTGTAADDLAGFIRQIVRKHLVADPDPRQAQLVAGVDATVTAQLRALLQEPSFRALEAAWRTLDRMARRIETSTSLRLYLFDVSAAELESALDDRPDGAAAELARALARAAARLPDGGRWSALVVLRSFGEDEFDHARLARLGMIARALGAPAFVDAAPALAGLGSWADAREARTLQGQRSPTLDLLRGSPAASWLCAAAPRVLLREPYGAAGEAVETFRFEELTEDTGHEDFLWGSAGATCALLVAQSFEQSGWSLRPGEVRDLDGLPLHVRKVDGESEVVPCAETVMREDVADRMMELGITPVATMRGTDTVHVVRFQSMASPPTALAGPWTE